MIHGIYLTNSIEPPCEWTTRAVGLLGGASASVLIFGFVITLFK